MVSYNFHTLINGRTEDANRTATASQIRFLKQTAGKRMEETKWQTQNARINNAVVQLNTNDDHLAYFWKLNWTSAPRKSRARVKLYAATGITGFSPVSAYHSPSKTAVFINTNYYGQCKSWALGALADYRDLHPGIHSIHGAVVDLHSEGVLFIAPTGTGKSVQAYGVLEAFPEARIHSDDWVHLRYSRSSPLAMAPEKHFYTRTNAVKHYPWLQKVFDESPCENVGERGGKRNYNGIPNSRAMILPRSIGKVCRKSRIKYTFLLRRDSKSPVEEKLTPERGVTVLEEGSFTVLPGAGPPSMWGRTKKEKWYNPYLLNRNLQHTRIERKFFQSLLEQTECYVLNTGREGAGRMQKRIQRLLR